jgi:Serine/threonine protein kinase
MDGLTVDNRSDIYSLGITLYEMLSGVTPFSSTSIPTLIKEKFSGKYRQISSYRQDVPPHIISVISKCIAVSPKDRFSSVTEIINALNTPEDIGTVIIGPKPKLAISVKKIVSVFSVITAIMLVIIIVLTANLAGKSSQLLKSKDEIVALKSTIDESISPNSTVGSVTDSPVKTTVTEASAAITSAGTVAETTAAPELTAAETTAAAETTVAVASDYNIGDKGPAGGFIFYINPDYEADGWKYLEAAPNDFPGSNNDYRIQWDNGEYIDTGATGTTIGTGMPNTQKIVDILSIGSYAAKLCSDLTQGGYSDWFLPSKDELNLIYENLHIKRIGSFESSGYWSSSESDAYSAWYQDFDSGLQSSYGYGKLDYGRVRAVRAFN